jgi:hypothetical protein
MFCSSDNPVSASSASWQIYCRGFQAQHTTESAICSMGLYSVIKKTRFGDKEVLFSEKICEAMCISFSAKI